jgi:hypothetical protein
MPRRPSPARATLKRWTLVKLPLSLLAGAVVTWGVACGCALWGPMPLTTTSEEGAITEWTSLIRSDHRPFVRWTTGHNQWRTHASCFGTAGVVDVHFIFAGCFEESGWPARALRMQTADHWDTAVRLNTSVRPPALLRAGADCMGLPTEVLPLGFTLNTLLVAGTLLSFVEGFAFARRLVRRAKGRCGACGYDRAGITMDAACPECGAGWRVSAGCDTRVAQQREGPGPPCGTLR